MCNRHVSISKKRKWSRFRTTQSWPQLQLFQTKVEDINTSLQTCQKSAQIAISRAINEYRRIARVSAPDDELSLQSQMLVPDIVGASRSYRNWYSANYRKSTIRKSSTVKFRGQH